MAGIDKTYVNKEQLKIAINWASSIETVTLENGYKFKPLDWIKSYNDIDNLEFYNNDYYVLWDTPTWFDRWLWNNCPLSFVKDRLQEQYDKNSLKYFESWIYEKPIHIKQKYTFLEIPSRKYYKRLISNARKNCRWAKNCKQATYYIIVKCPNEKFQRRYDQQTNNWYEIFGMLPCVDDFIWQKYHKRIPNKKSIMRQLRKWTFPKETIVTVRCFRYKLDFKILVK